MGVLKRARMVVYPLFWSHQIPFAVAVVTTAPPAAGVTPTATKLALSTDASRVSVPAHVPVTCIATLPHVLSREMLMASFSAVTLPCEKKKLPDCVRVVAL